MPKQQEFEVVIKFTRDYLDESVRLTPQKVQLEYTRLINSDRPYYVQHFSVAVRETTKTPSCPACRCLVTGHHGPLVGCEGGGGNCFCQLTEGEAVELGNRLGR